jgi:drug/metabolite transporter (DMT)-like permease
MVGYIGIVFAFLGDTLIFGQEFTVQEIIGVSVIAVFTIALNVQNLCKDD